jgi:hypothetical protein
VVRKKFGVPDPLFSLISDLKKLNGNGPKDASVKACEPLRDFRAPTECRKEKYYEIKPS